jgi:hypothetical protein
MRRIYYGNEAIEMFDTMTSGRTQFSLWPSKMRKHIGGLFVERTRGDDLVWTAYDFTDGTEVFIENFDDPLEAQKYAKGEMARTIDNLRI